MRRSEARSLAAPAASRATDAAFALTAALVAAAVYAGELRYFFAQDDFVSLGRLHGLVPPLTGPWRYLSGTAYFQLMGAVAGLHPLPYRLVTLLAHAATSALVYAACRRRTGGPAALAGAAFFAAHAASFTAIYSISGIGEILAAGFALAAWLLATRPDRLRWLALPVFAASLLSKESTLLLPAVVAVDAWSHRRAGDGTGARRGMVVALAALACVGAGVLFASDAFGVRRGLAAQAPYALGGVRDVVANLLTDLGWTVHIVLPLVHGFSDGVEPGVFPAGIVVAIVALAGCAVPALRARGWFTGIALWIALLLPVLPLAHHTYHYYLYGPLAGAALALAAALDLAVAATSRRAPRGVATPWAAAWPYAFAALLAVNGAALVRTIERHPFDDPELRADPTVDRALIAERVVTDLAAQPLPRGAAVWFWSPIAAARARAGGADSTRDSYWEINVRTALADGLAVRLFHPEVATVRFVHRFDPAPDSVRYAVYRPDGHLRVATSRELESALAGRAAEGDSPP